MIKYLISGQTAVLNDRTMHRDSLRKIRTGHGESKSHFAQLFFHMEN